MSYDIGPKIGIEGEKEFRQAIQQINTNVKTLGTEMLAVASAFDKGDKSTQALTAKNEVLNKQIDAQKNKINELQKGLTAAAEKYGENDRVTQGWQQAVNKATADLNNMERELSNNNKTLEEGSKKASIFEGSLSKLGTGLAAVGEVTIKSVAVMGAALVAATAAATKWVSNSVGVFAEYEDSMKQVQATMGLTGEEGEEAFNKLSDAAKEAGATTKFSATEAAGALNYLALAGYDVEKSIEALPTVLNLAAAGGLDLAYASDLVTDSMSALGLESEKLDSFVDELAKTSQKSNTSIAQLGEGILTVGGTAKILAGGTAELNTHLGILADNGIKGAEGGTALRNVILSLTAPTNKAAGALKNLGVEVGDAEGNLRPLNEVFKDLDASLAGMSDIEKTNVLNDIFNKVDLKSVNALLANSGERFDELSGYILEAEGAAQQMADTMEGGLAGSIRSLRSAYEGLQIVVGEQFAGIAQAVVGDVTGLVRDVTAILNDGFQEGDIEAIGERIAGFLVEGISKISEYLPEAIDMVASMLTSIINVLVDLLPTLVPPLLDGSIQLLQGLIDGIMSNIDPLMSMVVYLITAIIGFILQNLPLILEVGTKVLLALIDGILEMLPELLPAAIEAIIALAEGLIAALPELIARVPQIVETIAEVIVKNLPLIIDAALQIVMAVARALIENIPLITKSTIEITGSILKALLSGIANILTFAPRLFTSLVSEFRKIKWGQLGIDMITGITSGVSNAAKNLANSVVDAAKGALDGAKKFLGIRSPSTVMRDQVGKMIGAGMAEGIADSARQVDAAMAGLNSKLTADGSVSTSTNNKSNNSITEDNGDSGTTELTLNMYTTLDGEVVSKKVSKVQLKDNKITTRGLGVVTK
ncbi:tape measure protein [Clostridium aceticum]|uniref:Tape measure protein n=1 Tax=Clostridium aceticum TaxID=84022 RepID=A0A0G3WGN7_9CLOT|nr:phage tail tape measure protein [Clostridium aceticum]AKL96619.1 tape measure protein [Clostridium aceticum]